MRNLFPFLRLAILCVITLVSVDSAQAKPSPNEAPKQQAKEQNEWILDQSLSFGGNRIVFLSDKAFRIDNPGAKNRIVCKAPDWTVSLFRTDVPLLSNNTFEQGLQFFRYDPKSSESALKSTKPTEAIFQKLKIIKYGDETNGMWLTHDISVDPHCSTFYLACYLLKPVDGIPLRYCCKNKWVSRHPVVSKEWGTPFDDPRRSVVYLQTLKVEKVKFNASDFEIPSGYKVCGVPEVMNDKTKNAEVESLFREMKVGQDLGKKKN